MNFKWKNFNFILVILSIIIMPFKLVYANDNIIIKINNISNTNLNIIDNSGSEPWKSNIIIPHSYLAFNEKFNPKIKIYVTETGETLSSIADKFSIDGESLLISNSNLIAIENYDPDSIVYERFLKRNQIMHIPLEQGYIYEIKQGDSLSFIRNKYDIDSDEIINANNLISSELYTGDFLFLPWITEDKLNEIAESEEIKKHKNYYSSKYFAWWNCTYYVATRKKISWLWDAKEWIHNADDVWVPTGDEPHNGSIIVFAGKWMPRWHVRIVEKVLSPDEINISEMNYKGLNIVNTRVVNTSSKSIKGYIYPEE